jgi:predicted metal-binding protein
MVIQSEVEKFAFLRKLALELGASDAALIPASQVVVENRVVLKCRAGCNNYGKTMVCPPYSPTAEEFRKIVSEYSYALFMKFKSSAEADMNLRRNLGKSEADLPEDLKEKAQAFWSVWKDDKKKLLAAVLDLEKEAVHQGYPLAIGFISGACQLCEKCNVEAGICLHPDTARFSEEAVGVNVHATAMNAGIEMTVPFGKTPESFALLLID